MPAQWKLLTEQEACRIWNTNAERFDDCSPFQTFEWGQYHKALGWTPAHYAAFADNGEVRAMCLALLRRLPWRSGFLWCVGGPIGDIAVWNDLPDTILATQNLRRVYFRFRCDRRRCTSDALVLDRDGWMPASVTMGSSLSMELDLTAEPDALLGNFARNWRRSLRQAQKEDLIIKLTANPDIEEIRAVFAQMEGNKKLPELFSREKLESLFRHAASQLIFLQCEDRAGNLVALRGALIVGNRACDYLAASNAEGRRSLASYRLLWELLCRCRERGVMHYELGGIDPRENPGVFAFKRQTGAREVEFLGEWDWASSPFLRRLGNWVIGARQNFRNSKPYLRGRFSVVWPPAALKWFSDTMIFCPAIA
jgi:hypothetical protein